MPGLALGVFLTLCVQLAVRWAARYRWARELLQALDLRLLEPASSSTSGSMVGDGGGSDSSKRSGGVVGLEASIARFVGLLVRRLQRFWYGTLGRNGESVGLIARPPTSTTEGDDSATAERVLSGASASTSDSAQAARTGQASSSAGLADAGEAVEWVNMCWRKVGI